MTRGSGPAVRGAPLGEASSGGRWQIAVHTLDVIAGVALAGAVTAGAIGRGRPEHFVVATALVVGARAWLRPLNLGFAARSPVRSVLVGVLVYVAGMGFIVLTRHHALRTHALDLGQYAQTIWSIAHGDGPSSTVIPGYVTTVRMNAFGDHFSPIFYAMAPFVRLFPHVSVPLLIQTLALALGAVAVFAHARRRLPEPAAAGLATIYLLNPRCTASTFGTSIRRPSSFRRSWPRRPPMTRDASAGARSSSSPRPHVARTPRSPWSVLRSGSRSLGAASWWVRSSQSRACSCLRSI